MVGKGLQAYIASWGFADQQLHTQGATNVLIKGHYRNRIMGNSPKLMPLDSLLFGNLIHKVAWMAVLALNQPSEQRYSMGMPDKTWPTMMDA